MTVHPVTLSGEFEEVIVFPLSDLHIGSVEYDAKLFSRYIKHILSEPNRFCFLNGDLIDNALKSSCSDTYKATMGPREQILEAVITLKPLVEADRLWGILGGNHENRTDKESGISPAETIADKLGVPYFGTQVLFKIRFGKNKHSRNAYYTIYSTHGIGGGRLKGGKINAMDRMKNIVIADCYCMGHTHSQIVTASTVYIPDQKRDIINAKDMYFVNSGSFLDRGEGYAAQFMFEAQPLGCPSITLDAYERKIKVVMGDL